MASLNLQPAGEASINGFDSSQLGTMLAGEGTSSDGFGVGPHKLGLCAGPLYFDPTGLWTPTSTTMVTPAWTPIPDLLTGPQSLTPPTRESHDPISFHLLDVAVEQTALPPGLLDSPTDTPKSPHTPMLNTTVSPLASP